MRLFFLLGIFSIVFLFSCGQDQKSKERSLSEQSQEEKKNNSQIHPDEKLVYYTCPMEEHKHIHSDEPSKCPECNMDMVAVVETTNESKEYYGCSMAEDSHVRHDKPGNCEECGMELKPMRMQK